MNSRELALKVLYDIDVNNAYTNSSLNKTIKLADISSKDKALLYEIVYGVVKNRLKIDYIINKFSKVKAKKISSYVLNILRMGIYQVIFLDKIPDSAACNEAVKLAKKYSNKGGVGFVNGVLRNICREKDNIVFPDKETDFVKYLSVKYSYPEWIVKKLVDQYGEKCTESFISESNMPHNTDIRINTLKTTVENFCNILNKRDISYELSETAENIISVDANIDMTMLDEYKNGMFSLQNSSSKRAVDILAPESGETVIDVCAAPGGKSCAAAEKMDNIGKVFSFDLYEHKKGLILNSADRLSIDIIDADTWDATVLNKNFIGKADRVLVDAPCSGIGVIHKKPDIKWKRQEDDIKTLASVQKTILANASKYVKPGGVLMYSTCTVFKEENQDVVSEFLKHNPSFSVEHEEQILTTEKGESGFYICKMVLKG